MLHAALQDCFEHFFKTFSNKERVSIVTKNSSATDPQCFQSAGDWTDRGVKPEREGESDENITALYADLAISVCALMTLRFYGSWHTVNVISFPLPHSSQKHTPHAYGKMCCIARSSVWLFFPLLWTRHFVSRSLY